MILVIRPDLDHRVLLESGVGLACKNLQKGESKMMKTLKTPRMKDIMNKDVISVRETLPVTELARVLSDHRISGAPVVDRKHRLLGVVSGADLVSKKGTGFYDDFVMVDELLDGFVPEPKARVRDVMSPVIHRVEENTLVSDAIDLMLREHIHRVVVTRGEELAGIVTSTDLMRVLGGILRG